MCDSLPGCPCPNCAAGVPPKQQLPLRPLNIHSEKDCSSIHPNQTHDEWYEGLTMFADTSPHLAQPDEDFN